MADTPEGREALVPVHLHVQAALKARWVRESRAAGMRLTDWVVKKMEKSMELDQLWAALLAAQKAERAATAAHDVAEALGSGPDYYAAFDRMAQARADLQAAESAYDAAAGQ